MSLGGQLTELGIIKRSRERELIIKEEERHIAQALNVSDVPSNSQNTETNAQGSIISSPDREANVQGSIINSLDREANVQGQIINSPNREVAQENSRSLWDMLPCNIL